MIEDSRLGGPTGLRHRLVGGAVDVVTGECIDHQVDLILPGEVSLEWSRSTSSARASEQRGLGRGGRSGFDWELFLLDEELILVDQAGRSIRFPPFTEGTKRQVKAGLVLEQVASDRFRLSRRDQPTAELQLRGSGLPARTTGVISGQGWLRLTYDAEDRLRAVRSSEGPLLQLEWHQGLIVAGHLADEPGAPAEVVLRYRYSDDGLLLAAEARGQVVGQYSYDEIGRLRRRLEADGTATEFEYDRQGRCARVLAAEGLADYELEHYPEAHQTVVTRSDGARTIYTYDASGSITHLLVPGCCATEFFYDESGAPAGERDAAGDEWSYRLDWTGQPISKSCGAVTVTLDQARADSGDERRVPATVLECLYGDLFPYPDRLPDVYGLSPSLPPRVLKAIHKMEGVAADEEVEAERDQWGRLLRLELATGGVQRCGRDERGETTWYEDADGARYELERGPGGRLQRLRDPLGGLTQLAHAPSGELASIVDAAGGRTEFERDGAGRLTGVVRGGRLRERYGYDLRGLIAEKWGPRQEKLVEVTRGQGGLLTGLALGSGESCELEHDDKGRVTVARFGDHRLERAYAPAGGKRLREVIDGLGVEHRFVQGALEETRLLGRYTVRYEQTGEGVLEVTDPTLQSHQLEQLALGQVLRTLSNGLALYQQFGPSGRCLLSALFFAEDPDRAMTRSYVYSDGGKLLSCDDSALGETNYSYDAAHRLEKVYHPNGAIETYRFTPAGDVALRPELEPGEQGVELDERGNVRLRRLGSDGRMVWYHYDSLDRLVRVRFSDGREVAYEYDPFSRLLSRRGAEGKRRLVWDGDRLAAEVGPDRSHRLYIYADEVALVPMLLVDYAQEDDEFYLGKVSVPITNHLGCPELVQDEDGQVLWSASVDPLGHAAIVQGADFHQPLRLPGQWHDVETGLSFTRFRVSSPELGRFLQPDPLGVAGGLNLVGLALNPLAQLNLLGLGATGFCGYPAAAAAPEMMPLSEGTAPLLPTRILEAQDLLAKTRQDIRRSQQAALKALQTCRQVMSRDNQLRAENESTLAQQEEAWSDLMRRAEDPAFAAGAISRFLAIEQKALKLVDRMLGNTALEEDQRTEIHLGQAWKRFTIR